jgi:ADP-ribose pyrophosphatase YjhB (NUDIX family)
MSGDDRNGSSADEAAAATWLAWARELQALGQTGLAFNQDEYNSHRYRRLLQIAAEIVAAHTRLDALGVAENFAVQPGYATPKVDVRAAVVRGGRILLVQERADRRWAMPGGWADVGDLPSAMVAREAREESGLEVAARKVIGVYDANRGGTPLEFYHAYKVMFLCDVLGGEPRPGDETLAVDFFDAAALPPLSRERTNERHIAEALAHAIDPSRAAAFD